MKRTFAPQHFILLLGLAFMAIWMLTVYLIMEAQASKNGKNFLWESVLRDSPQAGLSRDAEARPFSQALVE